MLCECGKHEATIHEVVIKHGEKFEKHLCEHCAAKHGIKSQSPVPTGELLAKFVLSKAVPSSKKSPPSCQTCGLTWPEFKKHELLGCSDCYKAFESRLDPLIERTHDGGVRHVGKVPRGAAERSRLKGAGEDVLDPEAQAERIVALRHQLDEAVAGEQFERAARLRDEIRKLS